ncbi:hypothetical protein BDV96DRAFT_646881 [Lophiotrema nucula]|uniref:Heterokaryon incompatibility domain-containing protein n=1 Tax=Lophiotrema nucula TaxID=690887 RepID=A0A6A5Z9G5_9PLEO|nr:hypothetical protein BDV96DRAFT_646881 [Lophiotrema nucula]
MADSDFDDYDWMWMSDPDNSPDDDVTPLEPPRRQFPSHRLRNNVFSRKERMKRNHWCPHQIEYLAQVFDHDTFDYLANLEPLGPLRDHDACAAHSSCIAFNVDWSHYRTQHTTCACHCSMVEVPYRQLTDLIQNGHVPVITIEADEDALETGQRLKLSVHRRTNHKYVAISHVWAHGLGNPDQNALPFCQVRQLQQYLGDVPSTRRSGKQLRGRAFWMDTLCIPVKKADERLKIRNP